MIIVAIFVLSVSSLVGPVVFLKDSIILTETRRTPI